jgi:hypothetical protein
MQMFFLMGSSYKINYVRIARKHCEIVGLHRLKDEKYFGKCKVHSCTYVNEISRDVVSVSTSRSRDLPKVSSRSRLLESRAQAIISATTNQQQYCEQEAQLSQ